MDAADSPPTPKSLAVEEDLELLRTVAGRVTTNLQEEHARLQAEWRKLEAAKKALQDERAQFEVSKQGPQQAGPTPAATYVPQTPNTSVCSVPSSGSTVDFRMCPSILVIGPDGARLENILDIMARNRNRQVVKDPDTPHGSLLDLRAGGSTLSGDPLGLEDAADEELNHIASQATITLFEQMGTEIATGGIQDIAMKTLSYVNASYVNGQFKHTPKNAVVLSNVLRQLCAEVSTICAAEPVLLRLPAPVYVFGDIHGNFADLQYFTRSLVNFEQFSYTAHSFLFLGDYVDRGEWSVECVAYLWALKVKAPKRVFLLRGNHEDWHINGDEVHYAEGSFKAQCKKVFGKDTGDEMWNVMNTCFKDLPLAAVVNERIFCSHGGIPRLQRGQPDNRLALLSDPSFPRFNTFSAVPNEQQTDPKRALLRQMAFDLVWSDPSDYDEGLDDHGFGTNPRGGGIRTFGFKAVQDFLTANNLQFILRAHQEKSDGLKVSKHSRVVTIFSSSGYCGHGNGAGVVFVSSDGHIRMVIKSVDSL